MSDEEAILRGALKAVEDRERSCTDAVIIDSDHWERIIVPWHEIHLYLWDKIERLRGTQHERP